jgi:hypothetical protein
MALELEAAFSPAILPSLVDAVTISFTAPREATDVCMVLWEEDQWFTSDAEGRRPVRQWDFVAQFKGKIVNGKFVGVLDRTNDRKAGSRGLMVRIDGEPADKVHNVFVNPDRKGEVEGGVLEIVLDIEAKVNGKPLSYCSPAPLFVRDVIPKRPILTFLMGNDVGGFFAAAKAYWRKFGDVVDERHRTLVGMLDFLVDPSNRPTAQPWGEVNIVTHGQDVGPRGKGAKDEFSKALFPWRSGVDPHLHPITAELLVKEQNNLLLQRPDASSLDEDSRVVIRGCEIGTDQPLLDALRDRFGGRAVILAPKMVQKYAYRGKAPPYEVLLQYFFILLKGDRTAEFRGSTVARAAMQECVAGFQRRFPNVLDDAGWQALLNQRDAKLRRIRALRTGQFTTDFKPAPPQGYDFEGDVQANFRHKIAEDGPDSVDFTDYDDWAWRHSKRSVPGGLRVVSVGVRTRVEVLRRLMTVDPNTGERVPAVPNPSDPKQYGRSPSMMT